LPALLESKVFVVNFLAAGRGELATRFAARGVDRFADVRWEASTVACGAPILVGDSVAHAECVLVQNRGSRRSPGAHRTHRSREFERRHSLMYLRRMYAAWPDATPAPSR